MTQPGRAAAPRRGARSPAQLVLGVLVLLAVGGSLVMVFSTSAQLLRLAVVALLWVAVICSIAVTKYRRDADISASRAYELQRVYELELEREVNARREHELVVERELHAQLRANSTDELSGLREEVKGLRESLAVLFDGDLLVERVSLRAQSTRVRALNDTARAVDAERAALSGADEDGFVDAETEEHVDTVATAEQPAPAAAPQFEPAESAAPDSDPAESAAPDSAAPDSAAPDSDPADSDPAEPGAHSAGRSVSELIAAYGGRTVIRRARRRTD